MVFHGCAVVETKIKIPIHAKPHFSSKNANTYVSVFLVCIIKLYTLMK
jgi:hypothetical protein